MGSSAKTQLVTGVASGGEVSLFGFLPSGARIRAFDRGKNSLRATAIKAELVRRYGPAIRTVLKNGLGYLAELVDREVVPELPEPLQRDYTNIFAGFGWHYGDFRDVWASIPDHVLEAARDNIDNLELIHADIRDMNMQDSDIVYISNVYAKPRMKPGSHLITTVRSYDSEHLQFVDSKRTCHGGWQHGSSWDHKLYKVPGNESAVA